MGLSKWLTKIKVGEAKDTTYVTKKQKTFKKQARIEEK